MVVVHTGILVGAALEVVLVRRPFLPLLAATMFVLFVASNLMRFWVVRTLGELWSVQVMDSTRIRVVTTGPFRFVRHPNYTGVILEMISLPLIHTAWITALLTSAAHSITLSTRIRAEERVLMANPEDRKSVV